LLSFYLGFNIFMEGEKVIPDQTGKN
jgi:hypothetical protein